MSHALQEIAKFEQRLGLPAGFYRILLDETDWGFVVKLHSLFEAASTHILSIRLGSGKIENALAYLDFGNSKFGKCRLLLDLGILTTSQHSFLSLLSELRNQLIHRVENISFSFEAYFDHLDKNQFKSFCNRAGYNTPDCLDIGDTRVPRNQFIRENAKLTFWLTGSDILGCVIVEERFAELDEQRRELEKQELDLARRVRDLSPLLRLATKPPSDA